MRVFVAIELDDSVKESLAEFQSVCREALGPTNGRGIRWTRREQMHITLAFLGEISPQETEALCASLWRQAENLSAGRFQFTTIGCFPPRGAPRVLWVGTDEPSEVLVHSHAAVNRALAELGQTVEERDFVPHVTLARVKDGRDGRTLKRTAAELQFSALAQTAASLTVFESQLHSHGSEYRVLEKIPFRQPAC